MENSQIIESSLMEMLRARRLQVQPESGAPPPVLISGGSHSVSAQTTAQVPAQPPMTQDDITGAFPGSQIEHGFHVSDHGGVPVSPQVTTGEQALPESAPPATTGQRSEPFAYPRLFRHVKARLPWSKLEQVRIRNPKLHAQYQAASQQAVGATSFGGIQLAIERMLQIQELVSRSDAWKN
ncbi:MAG: hypothetical protein HQK57_03885 [Deltaproteobacteria bacterium]|nr:hypothetical protein [Deltaproteobacteria bacterium]